MRLERTLQRLENLGTMANRAMLRRCGVSLPLYGVAYPDMVTLGDAMHVDDELAVALWETGNHDARMLALRIADPQAMQPARIDSWAEGLDNFVITDVFASLVSATPFAASRRDCWTAQPAQWPGRAGWRLVAISARSDPTLDDDLFLHFLARLEANFGAAQARTADAMKSAMIVISQRNVRLLAAASELATRIARPRENSLSQAR